ncbi:MAG: GNAT family N-acetyltransferase [Lachnospiraceae bacterium]|nr:GNAT family N-acetyltransferase [Lachnospiraceae bacterium]
MIETKRLYLENFSGSDEQIKSMIKNWIADPFIQNEYGEPVYTDEAEVASLMDRYKNEPYRWAVYEKESDECIGQIAFCKVWEDVHTAEIEYCIGRGFQGHGYAGEVLSGIIDYTFINTDFVRLEAYHRRENTASGRVLIRSAMHQTDTVERFKREGVTPENEVCYSIEHDEWESERKGRKNDTGDQRK